MSKYWNEEHGENIICPYCGEEYEPSYDATYIGGENVNCYTEIVHTYTCDKCEKNLLCLAIKLDGNIKPIQLKAKPQKKR